MVKSYLNLKIGEPDGDSMGSRGRQDCSFELGGQATFPEGVHSKTGGKNLEFLKLDGSTMATSRE